MLFVIFWALGITRRRAAALAQTNVELERTREQAEQANRAKSSFLATMSHEIRTPMNGVLGMVEILAQGKVSDEQIDAIRTIRHSGLSLLRLIDDILDFSKIEAGKLDLERTRTRLHTLVEEVCTSLGSVAEKKRVYLHLFISPEVPETIWTDPTRLRQVLYNLAGNAIKFSAGRDELNGCVRIAVAVDQDSPSQLKFEISDNGIGIPTETVSNLFTVFTQAEVSTTRRFGGSGLGLAICDRLVSLMNGNIQVTSSVGVGSNFKVTLPCEAITDEAPDPVPDLDGLSCVIVESARYQARDLNRYLAYSNAKTHHCPDLHTAMESASRLRPPVIIIRGDEPDINFRSDSELGDGTAIGIRHVQISPHHATMTEPIDLNTIRINNIAVSRVRLVRAVASAAGLISPEVDIESVREERSFGSVTAPSVAEARSRGELILVAEDEPVNQKVILRQLSLLGYAAEVCGDGEEAFRLWKNGAYCLLLTDLHMPLMDGYTLTQSIRKSETGSKRIPIIALTANALRGEEARALTVGMDFYLTKPVQLTHLRDALSQWIPGRQSGFIESPATDDEAAESSLPALDIDVLTGIVGDDWEIIRELFVSYVEEVGSMAHKLHGAGDDYQLIAGLSHKLKSSSRSLGAQAFGDHCAEIENAAKAADHVALKEHLPRFDNMFRQVRTAIEELLEADELKQPNATAIEQLNA